MSVSRRSQQSPPPPPPPIPLRSNSATSMGPRSDPSTSSASPIGSSGLMNITSGSCERKPLSGMLSTMSTMSSSSVQSSQSQLLTTGSSPGLLGPIRMSASAQQIWPNDEGKRSPLDRRTTLPNVSSLFNSAAGPQVRSLRKLAEEALSHTTK